MKTIHREVGPASALSAFRPVKEQFLRMRCIEKRGARKGGEKRRREQRGRATGATGTTLEVEVAE